MSKKKIADKIAKLRAMTQANGASEAEALSAARRAAELAAQFEVEEAAIADAAKARGFSFDIGTRSADARANRSTRSRKPQAHYAIYCSTAIADLFSCKIVMGHTHGRSVDFMGHAPDVEVATYVFDVVREAMDREFHEYKRGHYRADKRAFQLGMSTRINQRLREMLRERRNNLAIAGKTNLPALIEQKEKAVAAAYKKAYPRVGSYGSRRSTVRNGDAYAAGRAAGDRVHLGTAAGGARRSTLLS